MNNYAKSKYLQKPITSITTLHNKLFHQLEEIEHKDHLKKGYDDPYF